MTTIRKLNRSQLESLVMRLMEKTKVFIMAGRDHNTVHAISLRAVAAMVRAV